ncbi:MAG: peptide deformylase [Sporocytophaga sp.]|nr:peptide deformylase [Sporocytophaga sp.]
MIYPIVAYGDPVLKKRAVDFDKGTDLKQLVADMFETMYNANGVGLAGPQIGLNQRIFVVDGSPMEEGLDDFKKAFINPEIIEETGEDWPYDEGCLSIPGVRSEVFRPYQLTIRYFDENWAEHEETYEGIRARIIQHEYDHIEGVLFVDHLSSIKKRLMKNKLTNISKGIVDVSYKMKFPVKK